MDEQFPSFLYLFFQEKKLLGFVITNLSLCFSVGNTAELTETFTTLVNKHSVIWYFLQKKREA